MPRTKPELSEQSLAEIAESLVLLESAQTSLYHAAEKLCHSSGFAPEWTKLVKLGGEAKALWYRIEEKAGGFAALHKRPSFLSKNDQVLVKASAGVPAQPPAGAFF